MAYFKIGDTDLSSYVCELNIETETNYHAETNAAGNTVVDFINKKRTIEVEIIPIDNAQMINIQSLIDNFSVLISFRNPKTGALEEGVQCIIPSHNADYYTIQANKVLFNKMKLKFIEL